MSDKAPRKNFLSAVISATSQGAVSAIVAAALSAIVEPVVNKILVERITFGEAWKAVTMEDCKKFFGTTISTNMIKFPIFEAANQAIQYVDLPPSSKSILTGVFFTTITLPITNYRYYKSMKENVSWNKLYTAYPATVLRDIIYVFARNYMNAITMTKFSELVKTSKVTQFLVMAWVVWFSCVASAPFNELRGYLLQKPGNWKKPKDFFEPHKFFRSTLIGATIMALSLGTGNIIREPIENLLKLIYLALFKKEAAAVVSPTTV